MKKLFKNSKIILSLVACALCVGAAAAGNSVNAISNPQIKVQRDAYVESIERYNKFVKDYYDIQDKIYTVNCRIYDCETRVRSWWNSSLDTQLKARADWYARRAVAYWWELGYIDSNIRQIDVNISNIHSEINKNENQIASDKAELNRLNVKLDDLLRYGEYWGYRY